jgi:hypothetical protein
MGSKSTAATSAAVDSGVSCPSVASLVCTSTTDPEGTVSAGAMVALKRLCVFSAERVKSGAGTGAWAAAASLAAASAAVSGPAGAQAANASSRNPVAKGRFMVGLLCMSCVRKAGVL